MSVRERSLGRGIVYIFNGRDFIVNSDLPLADYKEVRDCCRRNDPVEAAVKKRLRICGGLCKDLVSENITEL
ncbi:MAG: hypothetical protein K6T65_08345 [Peptococcaceae bacterium]|nr:hypothetical protein [Peptococcaceae bacterium]